MLYTQKIDACFSDIIGQAGVTATLYESFVTRSMAALKTLLQRHQAGVLPFLDLPEKRDDLALMTEVANRLRHACSDVLILGTGGSILGGQALCALSPGTFQGYAGAALPGPRLWFMDNVDPDHWAALLAGLPPQRTGVVVISKSGSTMETLCQFLAVRDWIGHPLAGRGVAICQPGRSALRDVAGENGMTILDHDRDIGGRYAVLSAVGLLPALIIGLDAEAFRRGAATTLRAAQRAAGQGDQCFAVAGAALIGALMEGQQTTKQTTIYVLMPYMDRLAGLAMWHRQLWAESLGKSGHGMTPAPARGTVDQHSQLQLYLDGPNDKFFTLITGDSVSQGPVISAGPGVPSYLVGRRMADVLSAQAQATYDVLVEKKRPVRCIKIKELKEETLGELLMHFMLETVLTAEIIGVNAFDQPAVDKGKTRARSHLVALSGAKKDQTTP